MRKLALTAKDPAPITLQGRREADAGVTLIEMMVVLVIIGVVAALVVPNVIGRPDQARVTVAQTDMKTIATSLELYRLDANRYPSTQQGLAALVTRPNVPPIPDSWAEGGYMTDVPTDPWGNLYLYESQKDGQDYTITSYGADGALGGSGVDADLIQTLSGKS